MPATQAHRSFESIPGALQDIPEQVIQTINPSIRAVGAVELNLQCLLQSVAVDYGINIDQQQSTVQQAQHQKTANANSAAEADAMGAALTAHQATPQAGGQQQEQAQTAEQHNSAGTARISPEKALSLLKCICSHQLTLGKFNAALLGQQKQQQPPDATAAQQSTSAAPPATAGSAPFALLQGPAPEQAATAPGAGDIEGGGASLSSADGLSGRQHAAGATAGTSGSTQQPVVASNTHAVEAGQAEATARGSNSPCSSRVGGLPLVSLDLSGQPLGLTGWHLLLKLLARNNTLKKLVASDCGIWAADAGSLLGPMFTAGSTYPVWPYQLHWLDLSGNRGIQLQGDLWHLGYFLNTAQQLRGLCLQHTGLSGNQLLQLVDLLASHIEVSKQYKQQHKGNSTAAIQPALSKLLCLKLGPPAEYGEQQGGSSAHWTIAAGAGQGTAAAGNASAWSDVLFAELLMRISQPPMPQLAVLELWGLSRQQQQQVLQFARPVIGAISAPGQQLSHTQPHPGCCRLSLLPPDQPLLRLEQAVPGLKCHVPPTPPARPATAGHVAATAADLAAGTVMVGTLTAAVNKPHIDNIFPAAVGAAFAPSPGDYLVRELPVQAAARTAQARTQPAVAAATEGQKYYQRQRHIGRVQQTHKHHHPATCKTGMQPMTNMAGPADVPVLADTAQQRSHLGEEANLFGAVAAPAGDDGYYSKDLGDVDIVMPQGRLARLAHHFSSRKRAPHPQREHQGVCRMVGKIDRHQQRQIARAYQQQQHAAHAQPVVDAMLKGRLHASAAVAGSNGAGLHHQSTDSQGIDSILNDALLGAQSNGPAAAGAANWQRQTGHAKRTTAAAIESLYDDQGYEPGSQDTEDPAGQHMNSQDSLDELMDESFVTGDAELSNDYHDADLDSVGWGSPQQGAIEGETKNSLYTGHLSYHQQQYDARRQLQHSKRHKGTQHQQQQKTNGQQHSRPANRRKCSLQPIFPEDDLSQPDAAVAGGSLSPYFGAAYSGGRRNSPIHSLSRPTHGWAANSRTPHQYTGYSSQEDGKSDAKADSNGNAEEEDELLAQQMDNQFVVDESADLKVGMTLPANLHRRHKPGPTGHQGPAGAAGAQQQGYRQQGGSSHIPEELQGYEHWDKDFERHGGLAQKGEELWGALDPNLPRAARRKHKCSGHADHALRQLEQARQRNQQRQGLQEADSNPDKGAGKTTVAEDTDNSLPELESDKRCVAANAKHGTVAQAAGHKRSRMKRHMFIDNAAADSGSDSSELRKSDDVSSNSCKDDAAAEPQRAGADRMANLGSMARGEQRKAMKLLVSKKAAIKAAHNPMSTAQHAAEASFVAAGQHCNSQRINALHTGLSSGGSSSDDAGGDRDGMQGTIAMEKARPVPTYKSHATSPGPAAAAVVGSRHCSRQVLLDSEPQDLQDEHPAMQQTQQRQYDDQNKQQQQWEPHQQHQTGRQQQRHRSHHRHGLTAAAFSEGAAADGTATAPPAAERDHERSIFNGKPNASDGAKNADINDRQGQDNPEANEAVKQLWNLEHRMEALEKQIEHVEHQIQAAEQQQAAAAARTSVTQQATSASLAGPHASETSHSTAVASAEGVAATVVLSVEELKFSLDQSKAKLRRLKHVHKQLEDLVPFKWDKKNGGPEAGTLKSMQPKSSKRQSRVPQRLSPGQTAQQERQWQLLARQQQQQCAANDTFPKTGTDAGSAWKTTAKGTVRQPKSSSQAPRSSKKRRGSTSCSSNSSSDSDDDLPLALVCARRTSITPAIDTPPGSTLAHAATAAGAGHMPLLPPLSAKAAGGRATTLPSEAAASAKQMLQAVSAQATVNSQSLPPAVVGAGAGASAPSAAAMPGPSATTAAAAARFATTALAQCMDWPVVGAACDDAHAVLAAPTLTTHQDAADCHIKEAIDRLQVGTAAAATAPGAHTSNASLGSQPQQQHIGRGHDIAAACQAPEALQCSIAQETSDPVGITGSLAISAAGRMCAEADCQPKAAAATQALAAGIVGACQAAGQSAYAATVPSSAVQQAQEILEHLSHGVAAEMQKPHSAASNDVIAVSIEAAHREIAAQAKAARGPQPFLAECVSVAAALTSGVRQAASMGQPLASMQVASGMLVSPPNTADMASRTPAAVPAEDGQQLSQATQQQQQSVARSQQHGQQRVLFASIMYSEAQSGIAVDPAKTIPDSEDDD